MSGPTKCCCIQPLYYKFVDLIWFHRTTISHLFTSFNHKPKNGEWICSVADLQAINTTLPVIAKCFLCMISQHQIRSDVEKFIRILAKLAAGMNLIYYYVKSSSCLRSCLLISSIIFIMRWSEIWNFMAPKYLESDRTLAHLIYFESICRHISLWSVKWKAENPQFHSVSEWNYVNQ